MSNLNNINFGIEGWVNPVPNGRLTSRTGARQVFKTDNGKTSSSYHHGVDIGAKKGSPVLAAMSGKVVQAGWINGYGNTVVVRAPDGTYVQYAHLNDFNVKIGQQLAAGSRLGAVGETGNSKGAHLDIIVTRNGKALNERGVPHTDAKPWLRDGGALAASYKPSKGYAPIQPNTAMAALNAVQQLAASSASSPAPALMTLPEDNTPQTQTQQTDASDALKAVEMLADQSQPDLAKTVAQYKADPIKFDQPSTAVSLVREATPESFSVEWAANMRDLINTADYNQQQEEALQKIFAYNPDPAPSYGKMPEGISTYIDSLIQKA